jgi:hypothetical protein
MNRQDETDRLTEQVRAIEFAVAWRRDQEQMALRRTDMPMPAVATRSDLDGHRRCSFQRWRIRWLAGVARLIGLASYPQAASRELHANSGAYRETPSLMGFSYFGGRRFA